MATDTLGNTRIGMFETVKLPDGRELKIASGTGTTVTLDSGVKMPNNRHMVSDPWAHEYFAEKKDDK